MDAEQQKSQERDRIGAWGFGCLGVLLLGGSLGGSAFLIHGVGLFLRGGQGSISSGAEARAHLVGLEQAVICVALAALPITATFSASRSWRWFQRAE